MNRREFIRDSAALVAGAALSPEGIARAAPEPKRKPNIVLIVADDLGYGELSVQGCKDIPTPNIDSIAANGTRFTDGYVSCPVCSPTRAGLMTGRYQQRFGHEFNPGPEENAQGNFGLPLTETALPQRLKGLGYATGMFGKWHLGFRDGYLPTDRGFDEFLGFLGGAHGYIAQGSPFPIPILRGKTAVDERRYLTEAFASEAAGFIDRHAADPFFLYLPFNAVHAPLQSTEKYVARFPRIGAPKRKTFAGMQSAMDDAVGVVLSKLRGLNLEEDTLIFFISDNGGPTPQTTSRNDPLRGYKAQTLEGGIRVPYMVQWKGRIPAGKLYNLPVISLDIHPTAVAAAGGKIPRDAKLDGVNLLPYLMGRASGRPHDRLMWRFGPQSAIRLGDWKLVVPPGGVTELHNLAEDIGEKTDLSAREPKKLKELQDAYEDWNRQLAAPLWGPGGAQRALRRGALRRRVLRP